MFSKAIDLHIALQIAEQHFEACRDRFDNEGCLWYFILKPAIVAALFTLLLETMKGLAGLSFGHLELTDVYMICAIPTFFLMIKAAVTRERRDKVSLTDIAMGYHGRVAALEKEVQGKISSDLTSWRNLLRERARQIMKPDNIELRARVEQQLRLQNWITLSLEHSESQVCLTRVRLKCTNYGDTVFVVGFVQNKSRLSVSRLKWRVTQAEKVQQLMSSDLEPVGAGEEKYFFVRLFDWADNTVVQFIGCDYVK